MTMDRSSGVAGLPWLPPGRTVVVPDRGEFFVRVHEHDDPSRPWLLLLHGWTASSDLQFFTAYEALAERYSFVGVDHRGHGRGLRSSRPFALEDCADDAAAIVRHLGLDSVVTIGYSMGGPISLLLTRRHPELVRALVVQATALEWRATWSERMRFRFVGLVGAVFRSPRLRGRMHEYAMKAIDENSEMLRPFIAWFVAEVTRNDPVAMVEAGKALAEYDARPWASSLDRPAAMLLTSRDRLVKPRKQRALAEALSATVREIEADHTVTMTHPIAFSDATVALLNDLLGEHEPPVTEAPRVVTAAPAVGDTEAIVDPSPDDAEPALRQPDSGADLRPGTPAARPAASSPGSSSAPSDPVAAAQPAGDTAAGHVNDGVAHDVDVNDDVDDGTAGTGGGGDDWSSPQPVSEWSAPAKGFEMGGYEPPAPAPESSSGTSSSGTSSESSTSGESPDPTRPA